MSDRMTTRGSKLKRQKNKQTLKICQSKWRTNEVSSLKTEITDITSLIRQEICCIYSIEE
jgi:hypothetical protein